MNETVKETGGAGPSHRGVEIGVAVAMAILALIGIYGSIKVGIGWGAEGPRAGLLPVLCQPGGSDLLRGESHQDPAESRMTARCSRSGARSARSWRWSCRPRSMSPRFRYLGIYVASALLIIAFMKWLGNYNWLMSIAVGVVVPILTFLMFEIWFLVPLPKGPLENLLGY